MSRATRESESPHGKIRKVERSGARSMSLSSMRTNPSMLEPSNMMSPASAFSNWEAGISTFLLTPRMSVNCRRRKRTLSLRVSSRTSFAEAFRRSGTSARDWDTAECSSRAAVVSIDPGAGTSLAPAEC